MKTTIKEYIYAIITILGVFLLIGTAGAIEVDHITYTQAFKQVAVGFAMTFAGGFGINLEDRRRKNSRRYKWED